MEVEANEKRRSSFAISLLSGGMAGTAVDVSLYPLDTIKTRLQSPQGFWNAGGFRGVYKGLSAAATGSAPSASLFFCTYELSKRLIKERYPNGSDALRNLMSGGMGEVVSPILSAFVIGVSYFNCRWHALCVFRLKSSSKECRQECMGLLLLQ